MNFRKRFLWPLVFSSCCLVALCVMTATSLFRQQATISEVLRENVASRRAATELEECLLDINALLKDRVESVAPLHVRAKAHLVQIERMADQPEEQLLSEHLNQSFAEYLHHWKTMPAPGHPDHQAAVKEATDLIEMNLLKSCDELMQFNGVRIEEAVDQHEQVLRQFAWGITGVSGLGGVAGLVLGFGVARSMSQSIRQLQVQIQDAAGRLGGELPAIVVTSYDGDWTGLQEQMNLLSGRIESILEKLSERERQVMRADQFAAVGQLATGVAHEIRNPLTSIKLLVQAGLEEGSVSLADEDLRVIEQEIRRMERSLKTFLDYARPPKLERRPTNLHTLVRSVATLIRGRAEKQNVQVVVSTPGPEDATLTVDGEQVKQVLVNLALNALDAMPTGGTLSLAVTRTATRAAHIRMADTGPGISAELMPKLFEPFVTTKETGLGIGLVISRRIVENHGGTIEIENGPDGGAAFTVSFPPDADVALPEEVVGINGGF